MNIGESEKKNDPNLATNAANLPSVLSLLSTTNPNRFKRFTQLVNTVFPFIRQVTVPSNPSSPSMVKIHLWQDDPTLERDDLTIPLSESGTGIGQVLSMLYVVFTSATPRTIVADEPQSFLHPGAIRRLFSIFQDFSLHQYIVTTHSPVVMSCAEASTILKVKNTSGVSHIQRIDRRENEAMRGILVEVGARLSDVFGADNILWVEGKTEEICFPVIVRVVAKRRLAGSMILALRDTGSLQRRDHKMVVDIYRRLSGGNALMPSALSFLLDAEGLSAEDQQDLKSESGGLMRFLPRRMYENYLIHPQAIATVCTSCDGFSAKPIRVEDVEKWLRTNRFDAAFLGRGVPDGTGDEATWIRSVDGARLLQRLFLDLSETKVAYEKTKHGYLITEWIASNAPAHFDEIKAILDSILGSQEPGKEHETNHHRRRTRSVEATSLAIFHLRPSEWQLTVSPTRRASFGA